MANTTELGVYHLGDPKYTKAYQPARTNNFRFLVQGLENLVRLGGDENNERDVWTGTAAQEVIDFSVIKFVEPDFQQEDIQVQRGNSSLYFAGKASYSEGDLEINDYIGADGKSILRAWQALSYNPVDDTIPSSDVYKKDATLLEYTSDGKLVKYWDIKGCWVKRINTTGYDNNSPGAKTVTATIRYDRAIPHIAD